MNIEVVEERSNNILVLLPVDRLDSTNAQKFESKVMDHITKGEQRMVVDFSRLNFISSSGLRVLLIAAKKLTASQGKLVLCNMQEHIREIFVISGFDRIILIKESRQTALDVFS